MTTEKTNIDFSNAVNAVRQQARFYKPLVDLADTLEKLGSLDNSKNEILADIVTLNKEKAVLTTDVNSLKAKRDKGHKEIEESINEIKEKANATLLAAKEEASSILSTANETALNKIKEAEIKADSIIVASNAKANEYELKAIEAQTKLDEIITAKDAAQASLDEINQKLEAAKAKVAGLLSN